MSDRRDYKSTLNLPETVFPMQAGLAKREPEWVARLEREAAYDQVMAATAGRPPYWFVDGPPYANGDIHIGHAVNKVLKDIICKAARLNGHQAAFVPGWDCHGLPIELQVEKKHGKVGEKLEAPAFRAQCRAYALEQIERQKVDFKRLGILADWERPYLTMQPAFEAEQLRCLATIVERGHVVRGFKPVHWCLDCGSSLAEAEVEYQDKTSTAIDVGFAVSDAADLARRFGLDQPTPAALVIWTTTPWTLPANQAVAVNASLRYALVRLPSQDLVVLAADRVEASARRYGLALTVLAEADGAALEGLRLRHPFAPREVPVILGEHVTLDTGTGLVHTAPAHGVEDYAVGLRYGLPVDNPVLSSGVFAEGTPVVAGLHVRKAEAPILEALDASGRLLHRAAFSHSYPHCWRHKSPLIFRATPQWFISMEAAGLRQQALDAIDTTRWIPDWGRNRIREMVAGRPDWCISRQRTWGVPVALFVHRQHQTLHPDSARLLRSVAERVEREGLEAWFGSRPEDWGVDPVEYEKVSDTLDVWFDSGVVHQCSFKSTQPQALVEGQAPQADFYLEGSDQHRGWFQSSLLTRVAMRGESPYRVVLTHGFTVDEQGRKMSKSLGNVVAPQQVLKTLGADVLRLWVAASDYSGEIAISDQLLERMADAYRRIRNTARYLLGSLKDFDPVRDAVPLSELVAIDRWALIQARQLQEQIREAYAQAEFHQVYQKLHNYCVVDLGGCYLDVLKDRLYTTRAGSLPRRSAQTVLFHIAEALVRWIAPILSFTADEIWTLLPGDRSASLFAQTWHRFPEGDEDGGLDWPRLLAAREAVRRELETLRGQGRIGSGLSARVRLQARGALLEALRTPGEELRFWLITSEVTVGEAGDGQGEERLEVEAEPSPHAKCERCWHQRPEVGSLAAHPTLCQRCVENVDGAGEQRRYL
ncbi:MAG TPA: isoleucine--tRNA ligase [Nevskiaceae bacterium]|nr:isoleucine--tRNA ligase [Nevskiaceae bacterium]